MALLLVGLNHKTAPVALRERVSRAGSGLTGASEGRTVAPEPKMSLLREVPERPFVSGATGWKPVPPPVWRGATGLLPVS